MLEECHMEGNLADAMLDLLSVDDYRQMLANAQQDKTPVMNAPGSGRKQSLMHG